MSPLTIVITIIVLVLIIMLIRYIFNDQNTLQNLQNGQTASTIDATSLATNGSSVPASNFAYSIWFYVNDWNYRYGEPKVIFGRMGATSNSTTQTSSVPGVNGLDPCPAVVLGAIENNLAITLGCYPGVNEEPTTPGGNTVTHTCGVANIPIQKWVNLVLSVYGRTMDIYIDGKLVRTCVLPGVAKIDTNAPIYVTPNGGFSGWTAKFQYWSDSCDPQKAWNIYEAGYGASMLSSIFGKYSVKVSLMDGNTEDSSFSD